MISSDPTALVWDIRPSQPKRATPSYFSAQGSGLQLRQYPREKPIQVKLEVDLKGLTNHGYVGLLFMVTLVPPQE